MVRSLRMVAVRATLPRPGLMTLRFTPELGRLGLVGDRVTFRTTPHQLHQWLRRIGTWIEYANSVVEE